MRIKSNSEWRKQYMRQYLRDKVNRNLTLKEGRLEGRIEGKIEAKIEIARNFLSMGLSAEDVSKGAEISLQEVEKLKKELLQE